MAVESPKYEVLNQDADFDLRKYSPYIIAETVVDANFDNASNVGFRRLAGYIFGGNTSKQKIAMTAPVGLKRRSEKIEMTTPVGQELRQGKYVITFTMPSKYRLESLPVPDDKMITLKSVDSKIIAAVRFSGTWSQARYETHLAELKKWIEKKQLKVMGEPLFARYNPPWTPWFMRRNEILIEVSGSGSVDPDR
jgi:hypothetical protein